MEIQGRNLQVFLVQNVGNASNSPGALLDVSSSVISVGDVGWALDEQLTKASISSCSITLVDNGTGDIWAWLQSNLNSTYGYCQPYLVIFHGGLAKFYGVIETKQIHRTKESVQITLTGNDWYQMASKITLSYKNTDGSYNPLWSRQPIQIQGTRAASSPASGRSEANMLVWLGYHGTGFYSMLGIKSTVLFPFPTATFQVGDTVNCSLNPGVPYTVSNLTGYYDIYGGTGHYTQVELSGFAWPCPVSGFNDYAFQTATFTRLSSSINITDHYTVNGTVAASTNKVPNFTIPMITVNGLFPGDKLDFRPDATRTSGETYTIADIDSQNFKITTVDPISTALIAGDALYYNDETQKQIVFTDFTKLISASNMALGKTDFSRFVSPVVSSPVLSFIALTGTPGLTNGIFCGYDLQTNMTGVDAFCVSPYYFKGNPDAGWTSYQDGALTKNVIWTNQLSTAPTYLMPDNTDTLAIYQPPRNRINPGNPRNVGLANMSTGDNAIARSLLVHDYSAYRRWLMLRTANTSTMTITWQTYNGTVWSGSTGATWTGNPPQSVIPFPAVASSLGSGASLLVLDSSGTLRLMYGSSTSSLVLTGNMATGSLVQTAYGAYLVWSNGYASITWSGSALVLTPASFSMNANINLLSNTFCALNATTMCVLADQTWLNPKNNAYETNNYLWQLSATPNSIIPNLSVLNSEYVAGSTTSISIMVKDPSGTNRIIGLLGSRLFQISTTISKCVDRMSVDGMTAMAVAENLAMIQNAMLVPTANGILNVISRNLSEAPLAINGISITKSKETRIFDNYTSKVNVSGAEDVIWDQESGLLGGKTIEILTHPYITTESQARAVALTYLSFFNVPRQQLQQEWTWTGTGAAPWESILPMSTITINGGIQQYYVLELNYSLSEYKATVKLITTT